VDQVEEEEKEKEGGAQIVQTVGQHSCESSRGEIARKVKIATITAAWSSNQELFFPRGSASGASTQHHVKVERWYRYGTGTCTNGGVV